MSQSGGFQITKMAAHVVVGMEQRGTALLWGQLPASTHGEVVVVVMVVM